MATGDEGTGDVFILRGGHVVDPTQDLDDDLDVLVEGSRIGALLAKGTPHQATSIDVRDSFVTAGLVDLHGHWWEGAPWGIRADINLRSGVTTACDAGTAGYEDFDGFRSIAMDQSPVRILAFLNIGAIGLASMLIGELEDSRLIRITETIEMARRHPDVIVGIKVRLDKHTCGPHVMARLGAGLDAAAGAGVPLMAHIGEGADFRQIGPRLRGGDIVTHAFHPGAGSGLLLDSRGQVLPEARRARKRGVIFDIGHGCGSFAWDTYRRAAGQGFDLDTISTDLHRLSVEGPVVDMLTTMSKFLHAGLSIREVVSAATERPAAAIHRDHEIGSLRVGRRADIAVFRVESGSFEFTDAYGRVERGSRRFVPVLTVMDGSIVMPSDVTIKLRPFTGGDHEVNCGAPLVSSPAPM